MLLSIKELENDIFQRFEKETHALYFGTGSIIFEPNSGKLSLTISHYTTENIEYKIIFKSNYCHRVTEESYITYFEDEDFNGFSFFEFGKNSRFKQDIVRNYSLGFALGDDIDMLNRIVSYRILSQNYFIDVLTAEEPIIELIEAKST